MYPSYETRSKEIAYEYKDSVHVPPHLHEAIEVVYVTKGSVELGVGQNLYHLNEGDLGVVFPNVIHHYQVFSKGENKAIYLFIAPSLFTGFLDDFKLYCPENPVIAKQNLQRDIVSAVKMLTQIEDENSIMGHAYAQIILAYVFTTVKLVEKDSVTENNLITNAVSYVAANFRESISLEKMARDLGVSKYVLSRMFAKTFHCNFCKYINKTRLNYVVSYLENTNISITELCLECGFDSQRTFNRVFKEEYKMTPREYRKRLTIINRA
ncbi:MAG: helix-turn-helix domain-containing protein [Lachnospiraceae bacterium]|nr:helix-turn-helix domain-containing protein [Lachnospiraceae bacterium]